MPYICAIISMLMRLKMQKIINNHFCGALFASANSEKAMIVVTGSDVLTEKLVSCLTCICAAYCDILSVLNNAEWVFKVN